MSDAEDTIIEQLKTKQVNLTEQIERYEEVYGYELEDTTEYSYARDVADVLDELRSQLADVESQLRESGGVR